METNINVLKAATIAPTAIPAIAPMDSPVDDPVDDNADDPVDDNVGNPVDDPVDDNVDDPATEPVAKLPLFVGELAGGVETVAPSSNNESCDFHTAAIKEDLGHDPVLQGLSFTQHPKNGGVVSLHVYHCLLPSMQSFGRKASEILGLKDAGKRLSSGQPDGVVLQGSIAQQPTNCGAVVQTNQLPPLGQVKLQFCEP